MTKRKNQELSPLLLLTVDGWDTNWKNNDILKQAETPNLDNLISTYPCTVLNISRNSEALRKNKDQSEVGYYEMGSGEDFFTPLHFIDKEIRNNSFFKNKNLLKAVDHVKNNNSNLHLLGLASSSMIHSSLDHLEKLLVMVKKEGLTSSQVYLHIILDGVDDHKEKGLEMIKEIGKMINEQGIGRIASVHGSLYAMDRANHWNRIAKSYLALVEGEGVETENIEKNLEKNYKKEIYDYEIMPTVRVEDGRAVTKVRSGDSLIFFNVEEDYVRELTEAFTVIEWDKFPNRRYVEKLFFVNFVSCKEEPPAQTAFCKKIPKSSLSEVLAEKSLKQLKLSGQRKNIHINYFFKGEKEIKLEYEDKETISSEKKNLVSKEQEITTKIGEKMLKYIKEDQYEFSLVNLANFRQSFFKEENREQFLEYIESVDNWIGKVIKEALNKDIIAIITSTSSLEGKNKVPILMISNDWEGKTLGWKQFPEKELDIVKPQGSLKHIYPTVLKIFNIRYNKDKLKPLF